MNNDSSFVDYCSATFALCIFYDDVDNLCHLGANPWSSMYEQTLEKYTRPINISSYSIVANRRTTVVITNHESALAI